MCRLSEAELYCVSTKMRWMSELMQFEIGMSTSRYLPPSGTAGFERINVSGKQPRPRSAAEDHREHVRFLHRHRPSTVLVCGSESTQSIVPKPTRFKTQGEISSDTQGTRGG